MVVEATAGEGAMVPAMEAAMTVRTALWEVYQVDKAVVMEVVVRVRVVRAVPRVGAVGTEAHCMAPRADTMAVAVMVAAA